MPDQQYGYCFRRRPTTPTCLRPCCLLWDHIVDDLGVDQPDVGLGDSDPQLRDLVLGINNLNEVLVGTTLVIVTSGYVSVMRLSIACSCLHRNMDAPFSWIAYSSWSLLQRTL